MRLYNNKVLQVKKYKGTFNVGKYATASQLL